ncbi:cell division protein FtsQ/DivIB [Demequina capsici]|uniref:Cell division protein FtsQ/DivIB n=1 Tax=Demequina capsici TaxID=3075620 RepID=A0AA96F7Y3_9MICO|nr:cell division protein FtsQ/DivIB [Demequina sp. OYTSA14]WNM23345.1 cell division protein FtsQ/DivIB [Demequina sp. OYTSA14]
MPDRPTTPARPPGAKGRPVAPKRDARDSPARVVPTSERRRPVSEIAETRTAVRVQENAAGPAAENPRTTTAVDPEVFTRVGGRETDGVTLRMRERLAEKRSAERRLVLRRWGRRGAVLAALLLLVWAVVMSPFLRFDASAAEISGSGPYVDTAAVDAAVAQYDGDSLALVDTAALVASLRAIPGIADATVERLWPSTLRIDIDARVPVAAVPVADGGYAIVDDSATTVTTVTDAPTDLPVVNVPLGDGSDRVLDAVLGVIDELPVDLRARVQDINADSEDSVSFTLRDGPQVEWGGVEDSATKAQVLVVLLGSPEASSAAVIDVSAPTLPITRAQ